MKKLELFEVKFLLDAVRSTTIKAAHAKDVAGLMDKLETEEQRLLESEPKQ
jgi:hypothetical protein